MSISTQVKKKTKLKLKAPPKYCVVFYNNEVTSFDQVMFLLIHAFNMSPQKAMDKTNEIDGSDRGVILINNKEVCDAKNQMVANLREYIQEKNLKHEVEPYKEE